MIASTLLDQLIGALRHHEQRPADQYRLVRPTFRLAYDAYRWMLRQPGWADIPDGDATSRYTLYRWIEIRKRHHVAWLERGGCER